MKLFLLLLSKVFFFSVTGSSLRSLQTQHGRVHLGQGARTQEPAHHPQIGQAHVRPVAVREEPQEGQRDGAADQDASGPEGVRLPG